jgi:hypothetical protein
MNTSNKTNKSECSCLLLTHNKRLASMFNMEMYHTHIATVATEIQDLLCFCPFFRTVWILGPLWLCDDFWTHSIIVISPIRYSTHIWNHAYCRNINMYHKDSCTCSCTMFNKPTYMCTQCTVRLFMPDSLIRICCWSWLGRFRSIPKYAQWLI